MKIGNTKIAAGIERNCWVWTGIVLLPTIHIEYYKRFYYHHDTLEIAIVWLKFHITINANYNFSKYGAH